MLEMLLLHVQWTVGAIAASTYIVCAMAMTLSQMGVTAQSLLLNPQVSEAARPQSFLLSRLPRPVTDVYRQTFTGRTSVRPDFVSEGML
jgi:hypothetical protein